jgi:hypothetical protein
MDYFPSLEDKMKRRRLSARFRAVAWTVCRVATDLALIVFGAGYTYQSFVNSRSEAEISAGVALTLLGCGLTALSVRSWRRRAIHGSMPKNE